MRQKNLYAMCFCPEHAAEDLVIDNKETEASVTLVVRYNSTHSENWPTDEECKLSVSMLNLYCKCGSHILWVQCLVNIPMVLCLSQKLLTVMSIEVWHSQISFVGNGSPDMFTSYFGHAF